ncbi:MAG: exodeoxyribonuclease VII large subunit [Alphaproteobacteria bacterium]|nr:exodeoxyribonuclease VII large subunit [Alphaproteobacteria bacterium]
MSDLIDDPEPGLNAPEFSVSELSGVVKRMIEGEFSHVRVKGEIGRVSRPASGHIYLDLKDNRAVLAGVIWKGVAAHLSTQPEEGMEVVATGRLTTFPGQSRYQMVIENIAPAGVGALMAMLEKRKKVLAAEGLFDETRKRAIPYLPDVIGVITSPSGAVIRDILHRLRDRFPRKVLIWPVTVQGPKSATEVAAAIDGFNRLEVGATIPRPDLLIVARGGGSIEDLWGFNEELVVRAAAASEIALISAVGHETDTTLIDYVSDQRAPTPSAAAELAVPVLADLLAHLAKLEERRIRAMSAALQARRQRVRDLARGLPQPGELVALQSQRLDHLADRLPKSLRSATEIKRVRLLKASVALRPQVLKQSIVQKRSYLERLTTSFSQVARSGTERQRARLDGLERMRLTLGYQQTLTRGYAVIRDLSGSVITKSKPASAAKGLEIEFQDGRVKIDPVQKGATAKKPVSAGKSTEQGSLF